MAIEYRTRGDVARDELAATFLGRPEFDALLFLDADQRHPPDLLEQLRDAAERDDLDMVCAHYYRRETKIIQSLCYPIGDGTYPQLPLLARPASGLTELLWTGFGCVLIRRRVLEAVAATLPAGESPVGIGPLPDVLGDHDNAGPDCRFFLRAHGLGFRLWLLGGLESLHAATIWLGHKSAARLIDYTRWANSAHDLLEERLRLHGMNSQAFKLRLTALEARKAGLVQQLQEAQGAGASVEQQGEYAKALYTLDGHLDECRAWIEWAEKYPPIEYPEQLPTRSNTSEHQTFEDDAATRAAVHHDRSAELVAMLPGNGVEHSGTAHAD